MLKIFLCICSVLHSPSKDLTQPVDTTNTTVSPYDIQLSLNNPDAQIVDLINPDAQIIDLIHIDDESSDFQMDTTETDQKNIALSSAAFPSKD